MFREKLYDDKWGTFYDGLNEKNRFGMMYNYFFILRRQFKIESRMLISDLFTKWLQLSLLAAAETDFGKLSKYCYEVSSSVFHLSRYVDE